MKANTGKEASYILVLCFLVFVSYLLPVLFKSFFVIDTGKVFLASKQSILLAIGFVLALAFEVKPLDQVIMVVSGAIFIFLLLIVAMDLLSAHTQKLPGLLLLLLLHGGIFLVIYDSVEIAPGLTNERRSRTL